MRKHEERRHRYSNNEITVFFQSCCRYLFPIHFTNYETVFQYFDEYSVFCQIELYISNIKFNLTNSYFLCWIFSWLKNTHIIQLSASLSSLHSFHYFYMFKYSKALHTSLERKKCTSRTRERWTAVQKFQGKCKTDHGK